MIILSIVKAIQILVFYSTISPLDTKYFNSNEISEFFECLFKNGFSVLHVNIRRVYKSFEAFKHFYSTVNYAFSARSLVVSDLRSEIKGYRFESGC